MSGLEVEVLRWNRELTFWYKCVSPKVWKLGFKEWTTATFGVLQDWISEQNAALWTNFATDFAPVLRL